jgi:surfeit locus 1 family protein
VTDVSQQPPRRLGPLALIVVFAALVALLALGTWQVQRLVWKEALLATIAARLQTAPAALDEIIVSKDAGEEIEYRPVRLAGRFRHDGEQFFFATHKGRTGYYVYTPFEVEGDRIIFVNRGFVDVDSKDPATRSQGQVGGPLALEGLARDRLAGKPSWAVPDNDLEKNVFYWKDLDAMAMNAGIDPAGARLVDFFVDADAAPNPGGQPIGGVTRISLPNNHLQYAITWYGLALALLGVTIVIWRRGRAGAK